VAVLNAIGLTRAGSLDVVDMALVATDGERIVHFGPVRFRTCADRERALLRAAAVCMLGMCYNQATTSPKESTS
jgi:1,6-anhydro-N-acetylmuramate kinase